MRTMIGLLGAGLLSVAYAATPASAGDRARGVFGDNGVAARADIMTPRGKARRIAFDTEVGTDTSLDVSPDGRWIVFDLLGHIYRMPSAGGSAECLTQGSGVALNMHPRFSPDGRRIAFVSDRSGQLNPWVMNADGGSPKIVLEDRNSRFYDPSWTPDGNSILAVRGEPTPGRAWHRRTSSIWRLPLAGGQPEPLLRGTIQQYYAPQLSADGAFLYFHTSFMAYRGYSVAQNGFHIQRRNMQTGAVEELPGRAPNWAPEPEESDNRWLANFGDVTSKAAAEFEPHPSPDGRFLAYGRAAPQTTMEYRGHRYRPSTELVLRDLQTGTERVLAAPITKDLHNMHAIYAEVQLPNFVWSPDSSAIILSIDGKIRRIAVNDGSMQELPFRAHVERVISEQVRGKLRIDDARLRVRYTEFPTSTRDGTRRAFVAAGRVWTAAASGRPSPVELPAGTGTQATPAWSADGSQLALASWDSSNRGQIWIHTPATGTSRQLTERAGEYLYPLWSSDGRFLFYVARGGSDAAIDPRKSPWSIDADWRIRRVELATGVTVEIARLTQLRRIALAADGRLQFARQLDPKAAQDLRGPWPSEEAQNQDFQLVSITADGGGEIVHLRFPARTPSSANDPVLSPDGTRVLYHADSQIFVETVADAARNADARGFVDTNPNHARPGRARIDVRGGADPYWLDDSTIEFADGATTVRYDVRTGARTVTDIALELPRAVPRGVVALTGGTLITLEAGQKPQLKGDIVIAGARIQCVGRCDLSKVDRKIDVSGKFLMPGMIDVHSHTLAEPTPVIPTYRSDSALPLSYGITTVIDPAIASSSLFNISDMIESGTLIGPRSFGTAEIVIDGEAADGSMSTSLGDIKTVSTPDDASYQVGRRVAWGAVSIKNYRQNRREQHQLLLDAARARHVTVTGEGGSTTFDLSLVMDGQTGWEHLSPSLPMHADATRFFGLAKATYSPTLIIGGHLQGSSAYFRPLADLASDARQRRFDTEDGIRNRARRTPVLRQKEEFSFPILAESLADVIRAGGYGAIGEHGEQPGLGSHWELWAYAEALAPWQALRVATYDGARFIGLEDELGTLRPGKLADVLVLDRNPLENIRNSTSVAAVMKAGSLYDATTLKPIWSAEGAAPGIAALRAATAERPPER